MSEYIGPGSCIFNPSCSNYTIDAIREYGAFKGILLGAWRILRCNPFNHKGGYDPVPKKEENIWISH